MKILPLLLLICLSLTAQAADRLPDELQQALKTAGIPAHAIAIVVQPLDGGAPVLRHRAEAAMNPASVMKLLTTYAGLELLGPAHVWRTEALATTTPLSGRLDGDLYLRGSGDPKLTQERLWLLLRELRGRGLQEIRGDLVLDRSAFAPAAHDPAAFDGKPLRPYNVGPDALLFNFAALRLLLIPEAGKVRVAAEPLPIGIEIVSRLQLTREATCGSDWRDRLEARIAPGQIILSGHYPFGCGEKTWNLAGLPGEVLLHGVFTRLWREMGGTFAGEWREAATPAGATLLAATESPPLGELVRDINKFSNNVMARQLFLKVGAGETVAAEQAIRNWLVQKGLSFPELVLDNGAGLSRQGRIAAGSLAQLLAAAWASPVMPEFVASLPVAAIDGTVRKRFNGHGFAGQAYLKTGLLEGVRGIAGYLQDRRGRRHAVVFLVNHAQAGAAQPAFDALLEWLWRGPCLPAEPACQGAAPPR